MGERFGCFEVFLVAEDRVGIGEDFIHTSLLRVEDALHLFGAEPADKCYGPVGHLAVHLLGRLVAGVEIGIAQSGHHLMLAVEGHPSANGIKSLGVALIEFPPHLVDGLPAEKAFHARLVVLVHVLAVFQNTEHVIEPRLQQGTARIVFAGGVGHGEGREIVAAHVSGEVKAVAAPVLEVGMKHQPIGVASGGEPGLTDEWREQTVCIVVEEHLNVEVHGALHGTVEQRDLAEVEMMGVELLLRQTFCRRGHQHGGGESEQQRVFHDLSLVFCYLVKCKDKCLFSYLQVSVVFYVSATVMILSLNPERRK